LDASGFYAQKYGKAGATVFASYNMGTPYDPADIGFSAIPKFKRYTINPKLYLFFSDKTTFNVGVNATKEERIGGDMLYLEGKGNNVHSYFEENNTNRVSTQMQFDHSINPASKFTFKNSVSFYDRSIDIPDYTFSGKQTASFTEATYLHRGEKAEWIGGLNLWADKFVLDHTSSADVVYYDHTTFGGFVQNTWNTSEKFVLETGLRGDFQNKYGFFALPRIAAMLKASPKLTIRLGADWVIKRQLFLRKTQSAFNSGTCCRLMKTLQKPKSLLVEILISILKLPLLMMYFSASMRCCFTPK
jgi:iron complex outermembrane receptor protein